MQKKNHELWKNLPMDQRPGVRYWLPAAAMDEEDLREEIRQLAERGFGRIEAVVLGFMLPPIEKEEEWGTEKWNHMMEIISDEAEKQGMVLDITNGPEWPISSPVIRSADDEAALYELTFGEMTVDGGLYEGNIPQRRKVHEEGQSKLLAVMAYKQKEEKILIKDSYLDLMPYAEETGTIHCILPEKEGPWKIFAFYEQPAVQKIKRGETYVIDHLSRAGIKACEQYWDSVIPDRKLDAMEAFFCDSLEYEVTLEWTRGFAEEFLKRRGYSILPYLPVIGLANTYPLTDIPGYSFESEGISDMINRDYLETITQCYCENHLLPLEQMANKYGKTVRYQVAYNRPFEVDRCGLYVGIPENEALGRAAIDLQKNMAAAAHLGRKKRYSFECAAEFGHSYGQDYENLFWWVKRSLMAGMNAQVLHGASYSGKYTGKTSVEEHLPGIEWPGYEAFGKLVSNYWNRTPSAEHARGCLDTITRLNMVFSRKSKVDCAILSGRYGSDGLGSEFCLYDDGGLLCNYGYHYEFVSEALLELSVCTVENGMLDAEGPAYRCLIIDTEHALSTAFLKKISHFAEDGLHVVWIGEKPLYGKFYSDWKESEKKEQWKSNLEKAWNAENCIHVSEKTQVPQALKHAGILPRIETGFGNQREDVMTSVHLDEETGNTYYVLYRYNRVICSPEDPNPDAVSVSAIYKKGTAKGSYERPGAKSKKIIPVQIEQKGKISCCNPWDGTEFALGAEEQNGRLYLEIPMEEDEMVILMAASEEKTESGLIQEEEMSVKFDSLRLYPFVPEKRTETSFLRSDFSSECQEYHLNELKPWRLLTPELEHFSGKGVYQGTITVKNPDRNARYLLYLGNICDTFVVYINGKRAGYPDQVMKRVDITELLQDGSNVVNVEVVSNLYNALFDENTYVGTDKMPYLPRNYGIWEEEGKEIKLMKYTAVKAEYE